jgi:heat shock protein HslJ
MQHIQSLVSSASIGVMTRAIVLLLSLLIVSCGEPVGDNRSGGRIAPSTTTYDGTWELVEGRAPEGPIGISQRWRITLTIDNDRLGGLSACNHYGASATIEGTSISIDGVGGTEMGCHPDVAETEARYHSALLAVETIERTGDTLTLDGADAKLVFGFVPPPPTRGLTDVRWELQSLIHGHGSDATASSVSPSHLYFASDGAFEGSTGCRVVDGEWIEEADRITFTSFGAEEGDCSDELAEQNNTIINLGDGFTFDIEGETLTIYGRFSEIGLQYRAGSD